MLIGILGRQGVGKTTFAIEFIPAGYELVNFGGRIKGEIEDFLRAKEVLYDPIGLYGTFVDKEESIIIPRYAFNEVIHAIADLDADGITITYRKLMEAWGEFKRRNDPNYWIDALFLSLDPTKNYIIDDVRKPREADIIKVLGGTVIKLERDDAPKGNESASEVCVDSAYYDIAIHQVSGFSADNLRGVSKEFISYFQSGQL